jgi:hypothetical protein
VPPDPAAGVPPELEPDGAVDPSLQDASSVAATATPANRRITA